ncbi:DNA processing protein [Ruminococcaceae bacterium YRB3002]|nr:DNA processing protein [Ruminococcaceae bacterium YRB3002]
MRHDINKALMYCTIMNNSLVDFRCIRELEERNIIGGYKDLYETLCRGIDLRLLTEGSRVKISELRTHMSILEAKYDYYYNIIRSKGISIIDDESEFYPVIWEGISGIPKVLFVIGDPAKLRSIDARGAVSVVGSRQPGRYSVYATGDFVRKLTERGIVTVSGMAMGIDRTAHVASMDAGGITVAVMPGGCDEIYPKQNVDVYRRIAEGGGVIISELPPSSGVRKQYFPSRNRLISALSDACLIMEAGEYSGTLHTASFAAAQGRDVYVLPNNIYADNCMGGLKLIGDGASVLLDENDVIDSVAERLLSRKVSCGTGVLRKDPEIIAAEIKRKIDKLPEEVTDKDIEFLINDELQVRDLSVDDLVARTKIPFYRISQILSDMEIRHMVFIQKGKYSLTMSH